MKRFCTSILLFLLLLSTSIAFAGDVFAQRSLAQEFDITVTAGHQARLFQKGAQYIPLLTTRPYKLPFSSQEAYEMILAGSRAHFDPMEVSTFVKSQPRFVEIASTWVDT